MKVTYPNFTHKNTSNKKQIGIAVCIQKSFLEKAAR